MKHWIFDLDGTLIDSFSHYFKNLEEIFGEHGIPFDSALKARCLRETPPQFFEYYLGAEKAAKASAKLFQKSNEDAMHIQPFPGIPAVIKKISESGAKIAVWTSRDLTSAKLVLESTGLGRYAELCISGTCVTKHKPDQEGLNRILAHFDCKGDVITLVGDHDYDMIAAKSAGARAVRASWHSYWVVDPCKHADHQFRSVPDFHAWLHEGIW